MKRDDWTVGREGIRRAGPKDRCLYCKRKLGEQHGPECVVRRRTVVIRLAVELVVAEPESFDEENIRFRYGDSSYCLNNLIDELGRLRDRLREEVPGSGGRAFVGGCLCTLPGTKVEYVREATEDDERGQRVFVGELPS